MKRYAFIHNNIVLKTGEAETIPDGAVELTAGVLFDKIIGGTYKNGEFTYLSDEQLQKNALAQQQKTKTRESITLTVGDLESLLGTVADATSYTTEMTCLDILAINASADSSYKTNRIKYFEQIYKTGNWQKAVEASQRWLDGRRSGKIKLTTDVKGLDKVFADIANRSTGVAKLIQAPEAQ